MQRINNAFDHLHSVADAAAISVFPSSRCPGFTSIISARDMDQRDGGEGEERLHEHRAVLSLQSSLPFWWYSRPVSVGYLSSPGWHPHTLSFITNASTDKLRFETSMHTLEFTCPAVHLLIQRSLFLWQPKPINFHLHHQDRAIVVIIVRLTRH